MRTEFNALATEVEASDGRISDALASRVSNVLSQMKPDYRVTPADLNSTDAVIHLADGIVPGWSILLRGKALEPDGHWHCNLRRSTSRDDDAFIGSGKGPVLSLAILAAALRTIGYQIRADSA